MCRQTQGDSSRDWRDAGTTRSWKRWEGLAHSLQEQSPDTLTADSSLQS